MMPLMDPRMMLQFLQGEEEEDELSQFAPPGGMPESNQYTVAPMMPQPSSNPFPLGSIQNPHPGQLEQLEAMLSQGQTDKANMEEAAFTSNRPDLFVNQAINNPENAREYMTKAKLTQDETGRQEAVAQGEREFEAKLTEQEINLTKDLLPQMGELAPRLARKLMSGGADPINNDDINAIKAKQYEKERRAWDAAKQAQIFDAMKDFKVAELDGVGNLKEVPANMANPAHKKQYDEKRALVEREIGMGPPPPAFLPSQEPSQTPGGFATRQKKVRVRNPQTGEMEEKEITESYNVPATATAPAKKEGEKKTTPPPKTLPKTDFQKGSLGSKVEEYKKMQTPGYRQASFNPLHQDPQQKKETMGKQLAIQIIQAGIKKGMQPQAIIAQAKKDKSIPPEIIKMIEQFGMKF